MFLTSCSSVTYTGQGLIPVYLGHQEKHVHKRVIEGEVDTFLWGLFPKNQSLYLDKMFRKKGLLSVANITIEEYQTTSQRFKEILSFGMFSSKSYIIKGYGREAKDFEN